MGPYCTFCGQRCFTHIPVETPPEMLKLYPKGVTIIATCTGGQALEIERYGTSYDVIQQAAEIMQRYFASKGIKTEEVA